MTWIEFPEELGRLDILQGIRSRHPNSELIGLDSSLMHGRLYWRKGTTFGSGDGGMRMSDLAEPRVSANIRHPTSAFHPKSSPFPFPLRLDPGPLPPNLGRDIPSRVPVPAGTCHSSGHAAMPTAVTLAILHDAFAEREAHMRAEISTA